MSTSDIHVYCKHEGDFGTIAERDRNIEKSLDRIESKQDEIVSKLNGLPFKIKVLWRGGFAILGLIILSALERTFGWLKP